ncbi:hypothetical protein AGLY_003088 [Aphis glycines]|uniref:Uncharacterized protein n=1 Tax=Aphis glycines TaxID=307491 RepID=A0A6G0U2J3_APHGL|nr:hypothetical protein AGLY_003088 [Aphis glycines]
MLPYFDAKCSGVNPFLVVAVTEASFSNNTDATCQQKSPWSSRLLRRVLTATLRCPRYPTWKLCEAVPGIHLSSVTQQYPYDVCLVGSGSKMQWRFSSHSRQIWIGLMLQQEYHDVHTAHETGDMQRIASKLALYLSSNSTTLIRFFLHAICNGVKPFNALASGSACFSNKSLATRMCPQWAAT